MWIFFALASAIAFALTTFLYRTKGIDPLVFNAGRYLATVPAVLIMMVIFKVNILSVSVIGWVLLLVLGIAGTIVFSMQIKAVQLSGIAKTQPFIALTPIFQILTAFVMLGEVPSIYGVLGVIGIGLGAYVVNIEKFHEGIFEPVLQIFRDKGTRMMVFISFAFSIMGVVFKMGAEEIGTMDFILLLFLTDAALGLIAIAAIKGKKGMERIIDKKNIRLLLINGHLWLASEMLFTIAIVSTLASYATAVKRTSILIAVILGGIFYKEDIKDTLIGSIIMLAGLTILVIFG